MMTNEQIAKLVKIYEGINTVHAQQFEGAALTAGQIEVMNHSLELFFNFLIEMCAINHLPVVDTPEAQGNF